MADVVTRLVVESKEYDSKIARATSGLTQFEKKCREVGGTLEFVEKEDLDFVKALGQMDTVASTATGKLGELKKAFTELSVQYKNLTDEEKKSPYGQALAASIDQIKGRIISLKTDLDDVSKSLGSAGGGTLDLNLGDGLKDAQGILKGITGALGDMGGSFSGASGIVSKFSGILGNLGGGAGGAIKGLSAIGPAAMSMAGPLVAAALAVQQLIEAFKRNDDAMNQLKTNAVPTISIFQQIQRLFDDIVQIFVDVNNATGGLVDTFQRFNPALLPLKALIAVVRTRFALWHEEVRVGATVLEYALGWIKKFGSDSSIVRWAKNALAGVEGFFTGLANKIEGIANTDFGKAMGLDKLYADLKNIWGSDRELNETNKQIIALEDNIQKLQNATTRADADSNVKISDLRAKAAQADKYTEQQRLDFLKQALAEEEAMAARRYEIAQKQYELAQKKASRTNSSDADKQEVSNAYAAMRQEEIALNEARRALARPIASLTNKVEGTSTVPVEVEPEVVIPEGSIAAVRKQLQELQSAFDLAPDAETRSALQQQMDALNQQLQEMQGKVKQDPVEVPIEFSSNGISAVKKQLTEALSGATIGGEEYLIATNKLADFSAFENLLKVSLENGIDTTALGDIFDKKIKLGMDVSDDAWEELVNAVNEKLASLDLDPIELDVKTGNIKTLGKEVEEQASGIGEGWKSVADAVNTVGGALQQIEDPGAKVAGIVAQAIANIALSFAEAAASPAVTGTGWGWLGFAAAGIATMISTIASIKQVTAGKFASGGVVGGNSYSGDRLMAYVNSGETILTPSQADKAMAGIQGNPMQNLQLSTEISGTNLRIVMNNDNRSKGGSRGYYANIH